MPITVVTDYKGIGDLCEPLVFTRWQQDLYWHLVTETRIQPVYSLERLLAAPWPTYVVIDRPKPQWLYDHASQLTARPDVQIFVITTCAETWRACLELARRSWATKEPIATLVTRGSISPAEGRAPLA